MTNQAKWLAAIAAAVVAFFAVWGINVVVDLPDEDPPDEFTLSAESFSDSVVLSWTPVPDSTDIVWLVWSLTGEPNSGQRLGTLEPSDNNHTDTDIAQGETRFYRIILVNGAGDLFFFSDWVPATATEELAEVDSLMISLSADTVLVGDSVRACLFGWTKESDPSLIPLVADSWNWEPEDEGVQLSIASGNGHCQWFEGVSAANAAGVIDVRRLALGLGRRHR